MGIRGLESIVVGVDFSACSATALARAAHIGSWSGASVHAVRVLDKLVVEEFRSASPENPPGVEDMKQWAREQWNQFAPDVQGKDRIPLEVVIGNPYEEIRKKTEEHQADLLVIGATGAASAPGRGGAGTVAVACIRKVNTQVLLTRENSSNPYQNIVACVDFSEQSGRALDIAGEIATRNKARLQVLHVFQAPWHKLHYMAPTSEAHPDFEQQYMDSLHGRLNAFVSRIKERTDIEPEQHLLEYPSHGEGIIQHARDTGAELVVLGTHGRRNLRDLLLGSTAERVVRGAECSILTIPSE